MNTDNTNNKQGGQSSDDASSDVKVSSAVVVVSPITTIAAVTTTDEENVAAGPVQKPHERVELLWMDISNFGEPAKFIMCSSTVLCLFIITGYILEYIFLFPGFKSYGWYFTMLQFCLFSLMSVFEILLRRIARSTVPLKMYMLLALIIMGSLGFTNASLEYLNYPAHIMFKTCNQIPVMIGGILILRKRYKLLDYIAILSMCIGLIWFTLTTYQSSPDFNILGVIMICCALVCNALLGNVQEKLMSMHDVHNVEMFMFSSFFAAVFTVIGLASANQLLTAVYFCAQHPIIYLHIAIISAFGYVGNIAVLTLVKQYGALTAVTVTTCRKALSILLSFVMFTKPFTMTYVWSGLLIILGIYLNVISKTGKHFLTKESVRSVIKSFTCGRSYQVNNHRSNKSNDIQPSSGPV